MTSRDFCFWLQGLLEVGNPKQLDGAQLKVIREHLDWVFEHEVGKKKVPEEPAKEGTESLKDAMKRIERQGTGRPRMIC